MCAPISELPFDISKKVKLENYMRYILLIRGDIYMYIYCKRENISILSVCNILLIICLIFYRNVVFTLKIGFINPVSSITIINTYRYRSLLGGRKRTLYDEVNYYD